MTCPRCASAQSDEVKFCTVCGANLQAVRQALEVREPEDKFNWENTWVAEMFMSAQEQKRRKAVQELSLGITPEIKRYQEIKAGVITSSVGIALSIFLYVFMQGLILSGNIPAGTAVILSHLWIAGVFPVFVGLALIANGVVIGKRLVEISKSQEQKELKSESPKQLRAPETNDFSSSPFSVTEQTTRHLQDLNQK